MEEFLKELFFYIHVEGGALSDEDKYGLQGFIECWGNLDRTNTTFEEWLEYAQLTEDDFKKFKEEIGAE